MWEKDQLFANNTVNKVQTRKNRMYYTYGKWKEVNMNYEKAQVISTFLCRGEEFEGLRVAYGGHWRSGLATTAKLIRKFEDGAKLAMGREYSNWS